jgi:DNA polymerase-3 subunit delta
MKLTLQQLDAHLAKTLAPIYIVSSDELLLTQEAANSIQTAAKQAEFIEHTRITAESNSEWSKILYSHAFSISLFAAKQFIELNLHHIKFNATTSKALQEYFEKPREDCVLLIRTNKIDGKTEKSAWFQAFEKKSIFIPIWPIAATQLPHWIMQRAKKLGVTLNKDMAEFIAAQAEGNLLAASQEIEKLALYMLTANNIDKDFFTDNTRFDVFDLVDSVLAGNHSRSLRILKNLAELDTEPTLILWALTREFRTLAEMMTQLKQGISFSSLCSKLHIFEKRQPSVRAFLQRQSIEKCWDLLLKSAQVDRMIKGFEMGNVWDGLEDLIMI